MRLEPSERLDFSKPQDWPAWKQRFEWFRCATKFNKENEVLQINALIYTYFLMGKEPKHVFKSFTFADGDEKKRTPKLSRNSTITSPQRKISFMSEHVSIAALRKKRNPWKRSFETFMSWLNIVNLEHKGMSTSGTESLVESLTNHCRKSYR